MNRAESSRTPCRRCSGNLFHERREGVIYFSCPSLPVKLFCSTHFATVIANYSTLSLKLSLSFFKFYPRKMIENYEKLLKGSIQKRVLTLFFYLCSYFWFTYFLSTFIESFFVFCFNPSPTDPTDLTHRGRSFWTRKGEERRKSLPFGK